MGNTFAIFAHDKAGLSVASNLNQAIATVWIQTSNLRVFYMKQPDAKYFSFARLFIDIRAYPDVLYVEARKI